MPNEACLNMHAAATKINKLKNDETFHQYLPKSHSHYIMIVLTKIANGNAPAREIIYVLCHKKSALKIFCLVHTHAAAELRRS
jgi:hypothetical protein